MAQERLRLLPSLVDLHVRVVSDPGLPHLALELVQSLPPTLRCLNYEDGGGLDEAPLHRPLLYRHMPPNMQITGWLTNRGMAGQSTLRRVVPLLYLQLLGA